MIDLGLIYFQHILYGLPQQVLEGATTGAYAQQVHTILSKLNKYPAIVKYISDNDTDLFTMSETWNRPDTTNANLCEITPPGYNLY